VSEPAYLAPGTLLRGRYEIVREIGRGGFSVVYLARDREVPSDVAVKLLVPPPAAARVARERMRREVQAVRGLSHANIVAVFDFLEEGPWSFIVMEYVAGPDLQVRVRDRGALDGEQAVRLGRDIAAALVAAHRRGILHRDVKPQNILLDPDGRARLTDFGSAKLDGQLGVTGTGALAGTLGYTAPEVLAGRRGDARADVYALGLTLYYALTAELPQQPSFHLPPTPSPGGYQPRSSAPGVPSWLDAVIARATTAAAEDRFPTAAAFDKALAQEDSPNFPERAIGTRCLLCGGPDPLGLALCPACGGGSAGAFDTLVFLDPPTGREQRREAETRLAALLPAFSAGAVEAVRGERPVFRIAGESAPRVLQELARHRLPARSIAARRSWSRLPAGVCLTVGSVLAGGGIAGMTVMPLFLWTTPLFAALLLASARRDLITPLVASPRRRAELPGELEREVLQALTQLPDGTARSLLADLTRMAHGLFGRLRRTGDTRNLGPELAELLTASCAAAADLAALDEHLSRLERQRERQAHLPAGWLDALSRCERSRDALVQRLLEAMTVLGQLQSMPAGSGNDLAVLTQGLQGEASAQAAAVKEIEQLLSPRHNDTV
jgi:serine/threonine protein kinase